MNSKETETNLQKTHLQVEWSQSGSPSTEALTADRVTMLLSRLVVVVMVPDLCNRLDHLVWRCTTQWPSGYIP